MTDSPEPAHADPLPIAVGDVIAREVTFDSGSIREFARLAGDDNPLHHDRAVAEASRFGTLIASGTHTTAVMMGCLASHFVTKGPSLGLRCQMTFRRAVRAGTTCRIEWTITGIAWKPSLRGHVVDLAGTLSTPEGEVAVAATSSCLFTLAEGTA